MKRILLTVILLFVTICVSAQTTFHSQRKCKAKGTVYGFVESDGQPLQGVQVSDGYEVVVTDKNGFYSIRSRKINGNVFVTSPRGYDYEVSPSQRPNYWGKLTQGAKKPERVDFNLKKRDNDKHVILALSDWHINTKYGMKQFKKVVAPAVKKKVESFGDIPVYTIATGDTTFDRDWYKNGFTIDDIPSYLESFKYPTPVFFTMGNHDHDGATPHTANTHFDAEKRYRDAMGPTYYSFNIGQVHYIVVDDIYYINDPLPVSEYGVVGKRNYTHDFTPEQLDWLRKDLAFVDKSTPVVISTHAPIYEFNKVPEKIQSGLDDPARFDQFIALLDGYENVHFITGHTHRLRTIYVPGKNIIEHNVGGLTTNSWKDIKGGFDGYHYTCDGAPIGYEVFEIDNKDFSWYYSNIFTEEKVQFQAWDMNEVKKVISEDPRYISFINDYTRLKDLRKWPENTVLVNVWAWDPTWKVEIRENGELLPTKRVKSMLPNYIYYYNIPKTVDLKSKHKKGGSRATLYMFPVQCKTADAPVEIKVTDHFGRVYTEVMERPKPFHQKMK